MNIIAQARAVRRRIILAKNRNVIALSHGHLQNQRDEMRFWVVILAYRAIFYRSCCIEITERHEANAIGAAHPFHHLFHDALGLAVWICRFCRIIFKDGNALWLAIDRGCRRKDNLIHAVLYHGFQQYLHTIDIVIEVFQGLFDAFTNQGIRCKMHDGIDGIFCENLIQDVSITDITLVEFSLWMYGIPMPRLKVINDDNRFPFFDQLMYGM